MAIAQIVCTSFKKELLEGTHVFGSNSFKIALYTDLASLGADTTAYTSDNEVSGTGYSAGGVALTAGTVTSGDGVGYVNFSDATWASSSITARGALIYNDTNGDRAVMVLDFGDDKTSSNSTFTVGMPANTSTAAMIRIT
jgi:hypothetical protein